MAVIIQHFGGDDDVTQQYHFADFPFGTGDFTIASFERTLDGDQGNRNANNNQHIIESGTYVQIL